MSSRDDADAATVGFRSSQDVEEYQRMNLYGGLTARGQGAAPPHPGRPYVTRDSVLERIDAKLDTIADKLAAVGHQQRVSWEAHDADGRRFETAFFVGLCDVLGRNKAAEVLVSYPHDRDATVYTLRGKPVTMTWLEAVVAVSEYDLGRSIGRKLLAALVEADGEALKGDMQAAVGRWSGE